jgi:hypothetical protein
MTGPPPVTLQWLAFNWGDAYLIHYGRDQWAALRRDTRRFLTAGTLDGLRTAIEADYAASPIPRDADPPGTADYLNTPDQDQDEAEDDGGAPGEDDGGGGAPGRDGERQDLLIRLRETFPQWAISYVPFPRAWTARKDGATICRKSPALLCIALIEREERQARHGPGPDWPPWGDMPLS